MKIKDTKKYSCVGEYHSGGGCLHSLVGTSDSERFWLINPIDRFSGEPILEFVTDDSQICMFGLDTSEYNAGETDIFFIAPFKIGLEFILQLQSTHFVRSPYRCFYNWLLARSLGLSSASTSYTYGHISLSDQEFTAEEIQACFTDAPREFNPHYQWIACTFGEGYAETPPTLKLLSDLLIDEDGEWNIEQHDWFKLLLLEPSETHTVHSVTFENSFTKLPH